MLKLQRPSEGRFQARRACVNSPCGLQNLDLKAISQPPQAALEGARGALQGAWRWRRHFAPLQRTNPTAQLLSLRVLDLRTLLASCATWTA